MCIVSKHRTEMFETWVTVFKAALFARWQLRTKLMSIVPAHANTLNYYYFFASRFAGNAKTIGAFISLWIYFNATPHVRALNRPVLIRHVYRPECEKIKCNRTNTLIYFVGSKMRGVRYTIRSVIGICELALTELLTKPINQRQLIRFAPILYLKWFHFDHVAHNAAIKSFMNFWHI